MDITVPYANDYFNCWKFKSRGYIRSKKETK